MSNEGGDESLPAGLDAPTAAPTNKIVDLMAREADEGLMPVESPTFTMAKPEEVTEFVERQRPRESQTRMTIVAVEPSDTVATRAKCEWEQCSSPSVGQWRWRREKYNGRDDAFDTAVYCDGHGTMAQPLGAVLVERFQ